MSNAASLCPVGLYCVPGADGVDSAIQDAIQEAMYCALEDAPTCVKLCINGDLVGIGVRIAFYLQAFMNAWLVIISPSESSQGLWSATILTAALVIPAMISKFNDNLTLYHAHMVMNFATLSTVTSLAVAPACKVWRKGAHREDPVDILPHPEPHRTADEENRLMRYRKKERTRGRMVLSVALLLQIILQWSWTITLFAHPFYSQPECSGNTVLILGIFVFRGEELNKGHFWRWSLWLLFSLFVTLGWGIHMVISSSDPVHDAPVSHGTIPQPSQPSRIHEDMPWRVRKWTASKARFEWLFSRRSIQWVVGAIVPPVDDEYFHKRVYHRISNGAAFFVVVMYLVVSELQMRMNDVFQGENDLLGFSQVAALLLAVTPGWTLAVAMFKRRAEKELQAPSDGMSNLGTPNPTTPVILVTRSGEFTPFTDRTPSPGYKVSPVPGEVDLDSIPHFNLHDRSGSSPDFDPYQQQDAVRDDQQPPSFPVPHLGQEGPQRRRTRIRSPSDENVFAPSSSRSPSPRQGPRRGSDAGLGLSGIQSSLLPPDRQQADSRRDSFGC